MASAVDQKKLEQLREDLRKVKEKSAKIKENIAKRQQEKCEIREISAKIKEELRLLREEDALLHAREVELDVIRAHLGSAVRESEQKLKDINEEIEQLCRSPLFK